MTSLHVKVIVDPASLDMAALSNTDNCCCDTSQLLQDQAIANVAEALKPAASL